jgi:hypothetical protein
LWRDGHGRREAPARLLVPPAWRPDARREVQQRLDRQRNSGERREAVLERGHAYEAETLERATTRGRRWTAEEDALLLSSVAPAYALAEELDRTLYAVRGRYRKLKWRERG